MTSSLKHSTETPDRPCRAQNQLTCKFHGVAGDFTEVPQVVQDNIDRRRSLREQADDAKSGLVDYAKSVGLLYRDISWATHDPGFRTSSGHIITDGERETLTNLETELQDAFSEEEDESRYQVAQVNGFVEHKIEEEFPNLTPSQRAQVGELVGLRFFGVENEWGDESDIVYKKRGFTTKELFSHVHDFEVRAKLRDLDRGYFTALSGRIPTEEQLDNVDEARAIRAQRKPTPVEGDQTFALLQDLTAID